MDTSEKSEPRRPIYHLIGLTRAYVEIDLPRRNGREKRPKNENGNLFQS